MSNRYFDNAATSYPKPREVADRVAQFIAECGGTYSRGAYSRAFTSTMMVEQCRDMVMERIGADSGYLCWSANSTDASNILFTALRCSLSRVLVSPMEHNAVMRVLYGLGIEWEVAPHFADGRVDTVALSALDLSRFDMVIINHQSNVNGVIQPIEDIRCAVGELPLMLDLSQSLGSTAVSVDRWGVDYAIFTAHKSLMGITGVGGFYARDISKLDAVRFGGTGSVSGKSPYAMPDTYPDKFQAGTPNMVGIVGLLGALSCSVVPQHSHTDFVNLVDRLSKVEGLRLYLAENWQDSSQQGEVISVRCDRMSVAELAQRVISDYGIECRSGTHCSPLAHITLGTIEGGTVRFSLSKYHTTEDLDYLCTSIIEVVSRP